MLFHQQQGQVVALAVCCNQGFAQLARDMGQVVGELAALATAKARLAGPACGAAAE